MPRILAVDDERSSLWIVQHYLRAAGYTVIACSSAVEAEAVFRSAPDSIDLLVTDVIMPEMTGLELARRLLDVNPGLPVLFTSGFTSEVWLPPHRNCVYAFLPKPAGERDLIREVNLLLRTTSRRIPSAAETAMVGAVSAA